MDLLLLMKVLSLRRHFRQRYAWSRKQIETHQNAELAKLRAFAYANSPFFRRYHEGYENKPLEDLPILTKTMLMENYDSLVTDHGVKRAEVETYLAAANKSNLFKKEYRVARTSGSSGQPGIFLYNKDEWITVLASYARANDWANINVGLSNRLKLAIVSSRVPWHQSAIVGKTLNSPIVPTIRIDATEPLDEIISKLNSFKPDQLVAYASMARLLANEQITGKLTISPKSIMCSSEVLTNDTRALIKQAWNKMPFNVFAATETAGIASECIMHTGMHMYEDLVITEVVDSKYKPVPIGEYGEKVLVTVLFSRTLPLLRYELSDSIKLSRNRCLCGKEFALIDSVQGRTEDNLYMQDINAAIRLVHPNIFHKIFDRVPVREWQVVLKADGLHIYYVTLSEANLEGILSKEIVSSLTDCGLKIPEIHLHRSSTLERTSMGKVKLISSEL